MTLDRASAHALLKTLYVVATVVEARDPYTGGHLWRVSQYSRILSQATDQPQSFVARVALGGFLHDLGKVGVPDAILKKKGRLTDEEYDVIKTHPDVGARILADHPLADLATNAVLSHHEMFNGKGYPNQLRGEHIPLDARIVAVCDAFDAMTSARPYRHRMPKEDAINIIEQNLGGQFDAKLGRQFIRLNKQGLLDEIIGHSEPGIPLQTCPICGPTIVVTRHHHSGDHLYCRVCGSEAKLHIDNGKIEITPTMRKGSPADLEPEIDTLLIDELVMKNVTEIFS